MIERIWRARFLVCKAGGYRRVCGLLVVLVIILYALQGLLISNSSDTVTQESGSSLLRDGDTKESNHETNDKTADACSSTLSASCTAPYFPFRIKAGGGPADPPLVCWNGRAIRLQYAKPTSLTVLELSVPEGHVVLERSHLLDHPKAYSSMLAQLKSARNDSYIVMVTWNGIPFTPSLANNLKSVGTLISPKFFGKVVDLYLIGQKGLLPGKGISDIVVTNRSSLALLDRTGCCPPLASSLGEDVDQEFARSNPGFLLAGQFRLGSYLKNCGLPKTCDGSEFAMHLYTGKDHGDPPKLCVNGQYVFETGINNGGRGINIAVVEPNKAEVVRVANYDTWGSDSTMLEVFLEDVQPDELAIIFTHDEASTKLSDLSRTIFFELGSSRIHDLKFRSSWYMIGRKNINGFTAYEKLNIGEKKNWADVIDERICVSRRLRGHQARPDPLPETRNIKRFNFCNRYNNASKYVDFCSEERALAPLVAAKLADVTLVNSPIFTDATAVLVLASKNLRYLQMQLETLIGQAGINQRLVKVAARGGPDADEMRQLVELFGFRYFAPTFRVNYVQFMRRAIEEVMEDLRPRYMIVIEENTILAPDFLHFFAVMEPLLEIDSDLAAIGAWNDNGYQKTSGDVGRVYRIDGFPHQGFLISRAFWERTRFEGGCCDKRPWEGWFSDRNVISIIPDVSRIARIATEDLLNNELARRLFVPRRSISREIATPVDNPFSLVQEKYDTALVTAIQESAKLSPTSDCDETKKELSKIGNRSSVALLEPVNSSSTHMNWWRAMSHCLGLFPLDGYYPPRGLYNGTLRFAPSESQQIFLIGANSSFRP